MQRKLLVLVGAIVVLAAVAAVIVFSPGVISATRPVTSITDAGAIAKTALVFVNNPYKDDYDALRVPGYVDNRAAAGLKAVHIEVQLFDKDGNRKEVVRYVVNEVPARGRKTFDANAGTIGDSRTAKVKVTSIEAYAR